MATSQHIHFISDLHLTNERSETVRRFVDYLASTSLADTGVSDLYILGDFFDAWVGDDDSSPPILLLKEAFKKATGTGLNIHLLTGNRDFLIGDAFCKATGIKAIPEYCTIDLFGTKTLLTHGDLLCTDDTGYQEFRKLTHSAEWQQELLSKSLEERLAIAQYYRQQSEQDKGTKSAEIMDVNALTVIETMQDFSVQRLIHGHTHRPAVHDLSVNNKPAQRFVLAEWDTCGSVLDWTKEGYVIHQID